MTVSISVLAAFGAAVSAGIAIGLSLARSGNRPPAPEEAVEWGPYSYQAGGIHALGDFSRSAEKLIEDFVVRTTTARNPGGYPSITRDEVERVAAKLLPGISKLLDEMQAP